MIKDCHTHIPRPGAVVNIDPTEVSGLPINGEGGIVYSVGIHPWNAASATPDALERLAEIARRTDVVAIGETGEDMLRPDIDLQTELFRRHIELSEELGKPLLLHVVRAFDRILAIRKQARPTVPWIVHGFRGNERLARQLLDNGLYLSYGERFNPKAVEITPSERLLAETDTSTVKIEEILAKIGKEPRGFELFKGL